MNGDLSSFAFDDELLTFLSEGNALIVATRSATLEPNVTRACGLRILAGDRVTVLMPRATSERAIANLRDNGEVAVCVSSPRNYRSIQLKGHYLDAKEGSDDDDVLCHDQLREFSDACAQFGVSRQKVRNLWLFDNWSIDVRVTAVYAQTPGPGAGARLGGGR